MRCFLKFLMLLFILTGCANDEGNPHQDTPKELVITAFSPTSAMAGTEITFVGENIIVSKEYSIFFNGIPSEDVQAFPSEIKAIVPQNATTGDVVIKYDDKSLNVGQLEIIEESSLVITNFSPNVAYVGDEVTFEGENIDPAITYSVTFNGMEGETTSVTETEIVAVVPEGATSGEIIISYEDSTLFVGTIEIIEELDKLYGYLPIEGADCEVLKINNLNIETGELLDEIALLHNQSCYSYLSSNFYREANIFVHTFTTRYGQGMPYGKACVIKNLTTGATGGWTLSDGTDYDGSILAAHDNKIYHIYRYDDSIDDIYEIRSANLNGTNIQILHEFPTNFIYEIENSGFLPSTNELVFFTKDGSGQPMFMSLNVETSMLTSSNISEIYSSIFISTDERIFGVKSLSNGQQEIVEINSSTGNVLNTLAVISGMEIVNIDYSFSSNRIFALLNETNNQQHIYKLNLTNGNTTTIPLDEQDEHLDFEGIYLND